jgi:hypothetical protein
MNKYVAPIASMLMWAAGTALVLITLSGQTRTWALWISAAALAVNIVAIVAEIKDGDS